MSDVEDIAAHLSHLTYGLPEGAGFVISSDLGSFGRAFDELATAANVEEMAERCAALVANVYVSTTATDAETFETIKKDGRGARGGEKHARYLVAFHADIDVEGPGHKGDKPLAPDFDEARALLDELPPASLLGNSGGGLQPWWLLETPLLITDTAATKALVRRWVTEVDRRAQLRGWTVDSTGELARVLRVIGTENRKKKLPAPLPVVLEAWERSTEEPTLPRRYRLEEILAVLPEDEPKPPKRSTKVSTSSKKSERTKSAGDLNILDACNAAPWSEVWPSDWERIDDGTKKVDSKTVELWKRPGASSEYSARCWEDEGCRLHSDAVSGLPAGDYSKAQLIAHWRGITLKTLALELLEVARDNARKATR